MRASTCSRFRSVFSSSPAASHSDCKPMSVQNSTIFSGRLPVIPIARLLGSGSKKIKAPAPNGAVSRAGEQRGSGASDDRNLNLNSTSHEALPRRPDHRVSLRRNIHLHARLERNHRHLVTRRDSVIKRDTTPANQVKLRTLNKGVNQIVIRRLVVRVRVVDTRKRQAVRLTPRLTVRLRRAQALIRDRRLLKRQREPIRRQVARNVNGSTARELRNRRRRRVSNRRNDNRLDVAVRRGARNISHCGPPLCRSPSEGLPPPRQAGGRDPGSTSAVEPDAPADTPSCSPGQPKHRYAGRLPAGHTHDACPYHEHAPTSGEAWGNPPVRRSKSPCTRTRGPRTWGSGRRAPGPRRGPPRGRACSAARSATPTS